MPSYGRFAWPVIGIVALSLTLSLALAGGKAPAIRYADQGPRWNDGLRALYYTQDQGSQMIPLAWLDALRQTDGRPFLDGSLERYGYLPTGNAVAPGLPVGFTTSNSAQGQMVGMTCAACHVRQITVDHVDYRLDGGPAFADFGAMLVDLDAAVHHVLSDRTAFASFATAVARTDASKSTDARSLRLDVERWWTRFHAWIAPSVPRARPWGPTRLDAMGLIYNRLAGLDLGSAPTDEIPGNIAAADAPTRYPFLWNAPRQDYAQWTGFSQNGNDFVALARNLGQLYGVFGTFHPRPAALPDGNPDYLAENSANFAGLGALEDAVKQLGPPVWPWPVDRALAHRGEAIFNRTTVNGGCVACHGIAPGEARPPAAGTWETRIQDVGTDRRAWKTLLRAVDTAGLAGAPVPGGPGALGSRDYALFLLKTAVVGSVVELQAVHNAKAAAAASAPAPAPKPNPMPMIEAPAMSHERMAGLMDIRMEPQSPAKPVTDVYEARVLQGIWAAAPYLHNGSVPTLSDLLKPSAERPKTFKVGPAYDVRAVGLAQDQQASAFVLETTGCEDRMSGNSRCGHEYGTHLPADEKRALLEYLKTL